MLPPIMLMTVSIEGVPVFLEELQVDGTVTFRWLEGLISGHKVSADQMVSLKKLVIFSGTKGHIVRSLVISTHAKDDTHKSRRCHFHS